ncbi:MAG: glycosyltransferase [bacterium]|nr:glycosyltransferase [bacterium]
MIKLSILTYNDNKIGSIKNQSLKEIEIIRLKLEDFKNIPEMLNEGINSSKGEYFTIFSGIKLLSTAYEDMVTSLDKKEDMAMAYSDYFEVYPDGVKKEKILRDYDGDWTERFEVGYLKVYRKSLIEEVNEWSEEYDFAFEYDLHLNLIDKYGFYHLRKPLYKYYLSLEEVEAREVGASKLYFAGKGKYGGFSYLYYSKDEEKEIEKAFKSMLKRRGIYLSHKNKEIAQDKEKEYGVKVSVIIPVYNREDYISRAIESVLNQTFTDFEVICVDNGSTDRTKEVIREYMRKDKRVKLIENYKNIIAYSFNLGIEAARGEYIAQLDSDDEYCLETLENMVEYLDSHPECGLAISYYELMDKNGKTLKEFGIVKHLEYDRNNILRVDGAGAVRVWRKKVVDEFGRFDVENFGRYAEDYDLILKLSEKYEVGRVHKVLYRYRRHPGNTDNLLDAELKVRNKNLARHMAAKRRIEINKRIAKCNVM